MAKEMSTRALEDWLRWELSDSETRAEDSEDIEFEAGFIAALKHVLLKLEGDI